MYSTILAITEIEKKAERTQIFFAKKVQNLKNKMKAKEMDAKYADKSLDRKQKEVQSILNGLSRESLFLLKTMLGK